MATPEPTPVASSGDPYLDELIARYNAGTLVFEDAVKLWAQAKGMDPGDEVPMMQVALALGAEMAEGYMDQVGPIPPPKGVRISDR